MKMKKIIQAMVIKYMKLTCTSLLMTLMVILPVYGEEDSRYCDADRRISLLALADMDLSGYEKKSRSLDVPAEGTSIDYYYDGDILKAIIAKYYRHAGRTEVTYYFESRENYMLEEIRYFYTRPFDIDNFSAVATDQDRFLICKNRISPVYGFGTFEQLHTRYYSRSNSRLERLLEYAPD
ncbi:MAG: hypothetical protein ACR2PR_12215 [Pseudohongiellaceae bacterium]